ncbi:MAG: hypothetical protein ACOCV1_03930 [Bacillota bacterium]
MKKILFVLIILLFTLPLFADSERTYEYFEDKNVTVKLVEDEAVRGKCIQADRDGFFIKRGETLYFIRYEYIIYVAFEN